jgi:hypothetical protein
MKTKLTRLLCTLILLGAVATAAASPMTYTETGYLTGTLGTTPFHNAAVTVTTVGDTANIVNGGGISLLDGTTTIQIEGFGLATFNGSDDSGVFAEDMSSHSLGLGIVGMWGNSSDGPKVFSMIFDASPSYDLSTSATLTSPSPDPDYTDFYPSGPFSTSLGDLSIDSASGTGTFTAAATSSVPEPSQIISLLALSGIGGLGALVKLRRRK